ncbi:phage regulatory CII family protein [Nitrosomonas sp. Nm34]|uniref:phage regulatory CII family protein n=1 Tax=Nitrosomonas sp. Nm34 TaxID=1881055 RepID=UPI0008E1EB9D|nr:phage regulatory CII family protein [Nitrosomonas sp. Nm34]SFI75163.1 hypothetical protein SAMN05428978_103236 [Nitrosomonas sp. Nm34]
MKRNPKQVHRALFLALQADAKNYPGGIRALAEALDLNGSTLANGLNPDHDSAPPTFATIVEIILLAQAKRTMFQLCSLTGQTTMDVDMEGADLSEEGQVKHFLSLVASASACLNTGSKYLEDGKFDAFERKNLAPLLLALHQVTASLYKRFSE